MDNNLYSNIPMYNVVSSNISAIGYDKENRIMKVIFKGNHTYVYLNVEPEIFNNIIGASSIGSALRENVTKYKDKYKYIKL